MRRGGVISCTILVLATGGCGPDGGGGDAGDGSVTDGPKDAPVDSTVDASTDASGDASGDAAPLDAASDARDGGVDAASLDAAADAPFDAADGSSSGACGDGVRALAEECDDGVIVTGDLCSSLCEVRDQLATRPPADGGAPSLRVLGTGRHPLAIGSSQVALAWLEPQTPTLGMTFYSAAGVPTGRVDRFGVGAVVTPYSAPVLAALPSGKFVVGFVDQGGDGDGLGVVARVVDPNVASSGAPVRVNQSTTSSQYDVDVVWSGGQLVFAWTDLSVFPADVRYRTFDAALNPTSAEQTLAGTSAGEGTVSLADHGGTLAAAWRELTGTQEIVRVKIGSAAFATPAASLSPYEYPPALVDLDSTHMLLVYAEATGQTTSKIRAAVIDVSAPGTLTPVDVGALAQDAGTPPSAYRPAAAKVGARVFIAWTQEAKLADPKLDELWLKECAWNGSALDLTAVELPVPRWDNHQPGDQRFPALAPSTLGPGGALGVAWVDLGSTLSGSATTDVAVSLFPVPILRKPNADGGGL